MSQSVRANVQPEILTWARETAGYQLGEAAQKLQVKPERLNFWESGEAQPTINQLRNMARVYKRPLGVFYLQEAPQGFLVVRDYRRLPGDGMRRFSPELTLEMRAAQERRELMLDLYEEIDEQPIPFAFAATIEDNPEEIGPRIREFLGITPGQQADWRNPREAFNAWRAHMEAAGVVVFQMAKVESKVVNGFAIAHDVLPVIAVNRKDVFPRRVFSLLHEFAHTALRLSGVSDLDVDADRPPEDQRTEVFCNAVAAAALMPGALFLAEDVIAEAPAALREWEDASIEELAQRYSVSREAVVRRLLTFDRTTQAFYRRKREQYADELRERQAIERERIRGRPFGRNPARETLSTSGEPFTRLVLNSYYRDRITLSEVSSFLGLRLKQVSRVEEYLGIA